MSLSSLADRYCPSPARPMWERVRRSAVAKKIASGAFWSVLGNGFGKFFAFIAAILVARILGRESFGEFGLIKSTATAFVAVSSFGMGMTATKYIAELLQTDKERTGRIIGLSYLFTFVSSFAVALLFYFLSPWLCETQLHNPALVKPLQIGALLLFLTTFAGTQISVMSGFQDFRGLAWTNGITGVLSLPVLVGGAYIWGMTGAVCGAVFGAGMNLLVNSIFIFRNTKKYQIRYAFRQAFKELPVLWSSNVPICLGTIIGVGMIWITQMLLAKQPDSQHELGYYYAAINYSAVLLFIPSMLGQVFFPVLNQVNEKQLLSAALKYVFLVTSIAVILALPMLIYSRVLMGLNGTEFAAGWFVLVFALLCCLTEIFSGVLWYILVTKNRNWEVLAITAVETAIIFISALVLLQLHYGAVGIITARITGRIFVSAALLVMIFGTADRFRANT